MVHNYRSRKATRKGNMTAQRPTWDRVHKKLNMSVDLCREVVTIRTYLHKDLKSKVAHACKRILRIRNKRTRRNPNAIQSSQKETSSIFSDRHPKLIKLWVVRTYVLMPSSPRMYAIHFSRILDQLGAPDYAHTYHPTYTYVPYGPHLCGTYVCLWLRDGEMYVRTYAPLLDLLKG